MRDRADGDPVEHFLEDGVAPPVIGGGPPESPFDIEPDPEPQGRHGQQHEPGYRAQRQEPPTSPIPVVRNVPREQEEPKRRSWVARMLRLPGK
ncbi:hypothetical protein [Actinophytocola glycyrrhizae]|uniref:Uncharacterized protein n=1 Tax=Actinophytocola glycyrrhizae TaxID=2044873 RepID=A0ABV9S603_9PSEU